MLSFLFYSILGAFVLLLALHFVAVTVDIKLFLAAVSKQSRCIYTLAPSSCVFLHHYLTVAPSVS